MDYSRLVISNNLKRNPAVMLLDKILPYKGGFRLEHVDDKFVRSSNFQIKDIPQLSENGVKEVVDLRSLTKKECDKLAAELQKFGIKFTNIPINPYKIKAWAPVVSDIVKNIQEKTLVHCTFGADRTGFVSALREYYNGLPMHEAINRMKERGFHGKFFHNIEMHLKKIAEENLSFD